MSENKERKLRRAVIKEELVALTGSWQEAVILQQLLHWTSTIHQSDALVREQAAAFRKMGMDKEADEITALIRDGWFYKSTTELSEEIMCIKKSQVNTYLNRLEEKKFFKSVPFSKTNKTRYIKVNVRYIRDELAKLGYPLEGFVWDDEVQMPETQDLSQSDFRKGENKPIRFPETPEIDENSSDKANPISGKAELSQSDFRKGLKSTIDDENPSNEANPISGKAELSQSENRKYTEITYTETTDVLSVMYVVQQLFFDKIGIEISAREAEQVILKAVETGKDIELAIEQTLEYFKLSGKRMMNPVGSVIYAMEKGWDLERLKKELNKDQKILQYGKKLARLSRKPLATKPLPASVQKQLDGNQESEQSMDPEDWAKKQAQLREKLKLMNERFIANRKEKKGESPVG